MRTILCALMLWMFPSYAVAAAKVQTITTPAGFHVWLVEEHSLPIVTMNVSFKGSGTAYDPEGKEGRTNMVAALMLEGAGNNSAKVFNEALEDDAIRLNVGAEDDVFHATLETLTANNEKAFSLLADALMRPRFDEDAIDRVRSKMQSLLLEQSTSPHYQLAKAWQETAYGAHPYARMGIGSDASLRTLSQHDFKAFTAHYITRENIIISVVGNVTAAEISRLVDKYLDDLPQHYAPDVQLKEIEIPSEAAQKIITQHMPQSLVAFGVQGLKRSDPDYIPAHVLNHLLGGGGMGSRLMQEIRVKRGLAYTVRTQMEPKAHAAAWRGFFATKNVQAKPALAALKETLQQFATQGVSSNELADAKAYLTGSFILDLSSNQEVANFLTVMQVHALGSDYLEKRNHLINAVTLEDIKRVSARIIDPARLRVVMVGQPEL